MTHNSKTDKRRPERDEGIDVTRSAKRLCTFPDQSLPQTGSLTADQDWASPWVQNEGFTGTRSLFEENEVIAFGEFITDWMNEDISKEFVDGFIQSKDMADPVCFDVVDDSGVEMLASPYSANAATCRSFGNPSPQACPTDDLSTHDVSFDPANRCLDEPKIQNKFENHLNSATELCSDDASQNAKSIQPVSEVDKSPGSDSTPVAANTALNCTNKVPDIEDCDTCFGVVSLLKGEIVSNYALCTYLTLIDCHHRNV